MFLKTLNKIYVPQSSTSSSNSKCAKDYSYSSPSTGFLQLPHPRLVQVPSDTATGLGLTLDVALGSGLSLVHCVHPLPKPCHCSASAPVPITRTLLVHFLSSLLPPMSSSLQVTRPRAVGTNSGWVSASKKPPVALQGQSPHTWA